MPSAPHEAPPTEGILAIYNAGTRARWYWTCPDCAHEFEPSFKRLDFPAQGLPADRGEGARMVCPSCGVVFEPHHKAELNAKGRWLHEAADGRVVPLGKGERSTKTASYWLHGPAAALASWSQIVTRYLEGIEAFRQRGDENLIRAAENVEIGIPSMPRSQINAARLSAAGLRSHAIEGSWKRIREDVLPAWARPDRQNCFAVDLAVPDEFTSPDPSPEPETQSNPANSAGFIISRPSRRAF